MRVAIVGDGKLSSWSPLSTIRQVYIADRMNDGRVNGGVQEIIFSDLTLEAMHSRCIGTPKGHNFGVIRVYDSRFRGAREGGYGGIGMKWCIRSSGRGAYDLRRNHAEYVQEHVCYVDSPQPYWISETSNKIGPSLYAADNTMDGSWRTMFQIVNRPIDNPGPSGNGLMLFERNRPYNVFGEGGGAWTIVGHQGPVVFRDNEHIDETVSERPGDDLRTYGSIVIWQEHEPDPVRNPELVMPWHNHGTYEMDDGFTVEKVVIESHKVRLPGGSRPVIAITGAREVDIHDFDIDAINIDMHIVTPYSAGDVGKVRFMHPTKRGLGTVYEGRKWSPFAYKSLVWGRRTRDLTSEFSHASVERMNEGDGLRGDYLTPLMAEPA